ncbi:uncharacterized protein VTP21DRAFT_7365 [Calcarisporiella thermophila]|uniref:uncharacterized protein n=1 Tax=Calcarisporiella thermophila TaxID=911321 RepID=UPI003744533C
MSELNSLRTELEPASLEKHASQDFIENLDQKKRSSIISDDGDAEHGRKLPRTGEETVRDASTWTAYVNIVCAVAGSGALGVPHAVEQSGWAGFALLILAHAMAAYSGVALIRCLYYKGAEFRLGSYMEVGEHAFGKIGKYLVTFFYFIILIGTPTLYLILAGGNFAQLLSHVGVGLSEKAWTFILAAVMAVPFILTKTMKEVAVLSIFGVLTTTVTIVIVVVVAIQTQITDPPANISHERIVPSNLPIALATFAFGYGGNVVYPHIEGTMRKPSHWAATFNISLVTVTILYLLVGIPSYYVYGQTTRSPVYNNLPEQAPRTVAVIFITMHVLLATPLYLTSFALEIERIFKIDRVHRTAKLEFLLRAAVRTVTIVVCAVIAAVVPYFDNVMSLLGAAGQGAVVFIFPILFYVKLYGWRNIRWYELVWCALALLIGLAGAVIGSVDAVKGLIVAVNGGTPTTSGAH